jgi:hypothetical protein
VKSVKPESNVNVSASVNGNENGNARSENEESTSVERWNESDCCNSRGSTTAPRRLAIDRRFETATTTSE